MNAKEVLKEYWGYESFRPQQEEVIQSILKGKDTLTLLPTGGGKSICYQIPAIIQEGVCLVISPLIALMEDQVSQLNKRGIKSIAIHSGLNFRQTQLELENAAHGRYKLIYLSPERLQNQNFRNWLKSIAISFIAVDEAHCISQWGHDFRPAYKRIKEIRNDFQVPVLALTATATPKVQEEIIEHLALKQASVFKNSFKRENLSLSVYELDNKHGKIIEVLQKTTGSAIVYCRNRRKCKDISEFLNASGISSDFYHGGLNQVERNEKQTKWINNQIRCIVCTNAFGMGIDKPDVRIVIHESPPDTLEAYYQEVGRAGRDGQKAFGLLLFNQGDLDLNEKLMELKFPAPTILKRVANSLYNFFSIAVGSGEYVSKEFSLNQFKDAYKYNTTEVYHILRALEQVELIHLTEAVYSPARFKVLCSYNQLYDYRLKNKNANALFDVLLRNNQAIFESYNKISLEEIAHSLKVTQEQVKRQFMLLHNSEVVDYRPATDKPILTFLLARPNELSTFLGSIVKLKKLNKEKWEETKKYLRNKDECRMSLLVHYFGEELKEECNICNNCYTNSKSESAHQSTMKVQILKTLDNKSLTKEEIVSKFSLAQAKYAIQALRILIDEGILVPSSNDKTKWQVKKG